MSLNAKELSEVQSLLSGLQEYMNIAKARLSNPKIKGWVRSYKGQDLASLLDGMKYVCMDESGDVFAFEKKPLFEGGMWDVKGGGMQPLFDSLTYTGSAGGSLVRVQDLLPDLGLDLPE